MTDGEGRFVVEGIDPAEPLVVVEPDDFAPVVLRPTGDAADRADVGVVVLLPGRSISGVVLDREGRPCAGVGVAATPTGDDRPWNRSATTGDDGRFVIVALAEGSYRIESQIGSGFGQTIELVLPSVPAGATDVRLEPPRGLHVKFRLLLAADRTPVRVGVVDVTVKQGAAGGISGRGWSSSTPTLDSVVYAFDAPGTVTVDVKVPGYETVTIEDIDVREDRDTDVDVLLRPAAPSER